MVGALRTYFKSKKSQNAKRTSGQSLAIAASARKRQRRHNVSSIMTCVACQIIYVLFQKAKARLQVLHQSTGLDDGAKKKIAPVLLAKYMSSEESLVEDSSDDDRNNHASGSDTENAAITKSGKKKLL